MVYFRRIPGLDQPTALDSLAALLKVLWDGWVSLEMLQSHFPIVGSEKDSWVTGRLRSPLGTAILAISIVMVFYLSGWMAEKLVLSRQVVSAIYTGNAGLVAVLLLVSRRTWPLLMAADFLGSALHGLHFGLKPRMLVLIVTGATIE